MHAGEAFRQWMEEQSEDVKCDAKKGAGWKCNLVGDATTLGNNIGNYPGKKPKPPTPRSIDDVTDSDWPSQAHHLIPHQQLIKHPVTRWLTTNPKRASKTIYKDNDYDVDAGVNGKWMPYVSSLPEWKKASKKKKQDLANKVMKAAGIQLHQGPHSFKPYGPSDPGYKTRVGEYLKAIVDNALEHDESGCDPCSKAADADKKAPRRTIARFVDNASENLEADIDACRIFVSRRAAEYYYTILYPTTPPNA
jgi:hypothetical protein